MEDGIENGGAESVEPGIGGSRVCGSLLGGKVNREGEGQESWTIGNAILFRPGGDISSVLKVLIFPTRAQDFPAARDLC